MSDTDRRHVRVYYSIVEDERFADIYHDPRHLGTWLQLLLVADAMFPAASPLPAFVDPDSVKVLVEAGLIEEMPHKHFRVHGLSSERDKRSHSARNAAAMRWHTDTGTVRNAEPMPSRARAEQEQSKSSSAPASGKNGDDPVAETLFGVYGGNPSKAVMEWGDRLANEYGAEAAARAIGEAATTGREKLMGRAEGSLKLVARAADRTEAADERERLRQKRAAVRLPATIVDPAPEKVADIMENIAKSLGTHRKEASA